MICLDGMLAGSQSRNAKCQLSAYIRVKCGADHPNVLGV